MAGYKDNRKSKFNPYGEANFLSKMLLMFANPLLRVANRKEEVKMEDLYDCLEEDSAQYQGSNLEKNWKKLMKTSGVENGTPSLLRAVFTTYGPLFSLYAIGAIAEEFLRITQPVLLGLLIDHFADNASDGYFYAGLVSFNAFALAVVHSPYFWAMERLGMQTRVSLCTLIYKKLLRLSNKSLVKTSAGQINNLLTNDVSRFDQVYKYLHYLWIGPLEAVIVSVLLYRLIGWACLPGYGFMILLIPTQGCMANAFGKLRQRTAKFTDKRVALMTEIITSIRVIKMYAWEDAFRQLVQRVRKSEVSKILLASFVIGVNLVLGVFGNRLLDVGMIIAYTLVSNKPIKASTIFQVVSFCRILTSSFMYNFPKAVQLASECNVTISRIQRLLLLEDKENFGIKNTADLTKEVYVSMKQITCSWNKNLSKATLQDITFDLLKGELLVIVGPVGCGKSSLLSAVLRELPIQSGSCKSKGRISYAPQQPWIITGTVKENILLGNAYHEKKFKSVIEVCALERDLNMFRNGEDTLIGERGVTLSGGQKARVNLARVIYDDADVMLLDDPLSAVDSEVGRHIFNECIMGYLADKPRILITHQLQYLHGADKVLVLRDGYIEERGTAMELKGKGVSFAEFMNEDREEGKEIDDKYSGVKKEQMTGHKNDGYIEERGTAMELKGKGVSFAEFTNEDWEKSRVGDEDKYSAVKKEPMTGRRSVQLISKETSENDSSPCMLKEETQRRGCIEWNIYGRYFKSGTSWFGIIILIFSLMIPQVVYVISDFWLAIWADAEECQNLMSNADLTYTTIAPTDINFSTLTTEESAAIYGGLVACVFFFCIVRAFVCLQIMVTSATNLHAKMFEAVLRSPTLFFDTNPAEFPVVYPDGIFEVGAVSSKAFYLKIVQGRIQNRFTKDIGTMDEQLPMTCLMVAQLLLRIVATIYLNIVLNYVTLVIILPLILLFVFLRRYSLMATRSLKRLDGIAQSPILEHTVSSLHGLWTIRSFNKQPEFIAKYYMLQDRHTQVWFAYLSCIRWLSLRLDLLLSIFVAGVSFSSVLASENLDAGLVGLLLNNTIALTTTFQHCVRQTAKVENQMTSTERVLEYTKLNPEAPLDIQANRPKGTWPERGSIRFYKMHLNYTEGAPFVLKNVTCTIQSKEKIGIVGRTGAGKSSLVSALLRLTEPIGDIFIDDVSIMRLGLHDVRKNISTIPQDPVLFTGSLRRNLDPFRDYQDEELWRALEDVQLHEMVRESPRKLEMEVGDKGSNLSVGQRQLLCLARAIIAQNRILLLDEATANVDPRTDALIQNTIRNKFSQCTVLMIAHRLNTVMDSDRIMVMDKGKLVEFDHPYKLLQNINGTFFNLVIKAGTSEATRLKQIAWESFERKTKTVEDDFRVSHPNGILNFAEEEVHGNPGVADDTNDGDGLQEHLTRTFETEQGEFHHSKK